MSKKTQTRLFFVGVMAMVGLYIYLSSIGW